MPIGLLIRPSVSVSWSLELMPSEAKATLAGMATSGLHSVITTVYGSGASSLARLPVYSGVLHLALSSYPVIAPPAPEEGGVEADAAEPTAEATRAVPAIAIAVLRQWRVIRVSPCSRGSRAVARCLSTAVVVRREDNRRWLVARP